ncbi:MAG: hypothetical protein ACI4IE_01935 [Eubacterium sp.]
MNSEFERMKNLLSGIGIQFGEKGFSTAEITAYAFGLSMVRDYIDSISSEIFMQGDTLNSLEKYVSLLDIDITGKNTRQVKESIIGALSAGFGAFDKTKFYEEFALIGSGTLEISEDCLIFRDVDYDDFYRLGRFIRGYILPFTHTKCSGLGLSWWERDNCELTFHQMDALLLPFGIIDTIEGSEIELEL